MRHPCHSLRDHHMSNPCFFTPYAGLSRDADRQVLDVLKRSAANTGAGRGNRIALGEGEVQPFCRERLLFGQLSPWFSPSSPLLQGHRPTGAPAPGIVRGWGALGRGARAAKGWNAKTPAWLVRAGPGCIPCIRQCCTWAIDARPFLAPAHHSTTASCTSWYLYMRSSGRFSRNQRGMWSSTRLQVA